MANQPRSKIYEKVVLLLKTGSFTTLQIAEKTGINWETAKNAVETLHRINLISSHEQHNKMYYTIDEANFLQLRKGTLLGLPLSQEQEETTQALLARIKQRWTKLVGTIIKKTFQQKILVRLIQENSIVNVPYGWYLFGECAVLSNFEEKEIKPIVAYDQQIDRLILEHKQFMDTQELLRYDYTKKGNQLYLLRIRINHLLLKPFTNESLPSLKQDVRDLLFNFPNTKENESLVESLNAFASMIFRLVNHKNEKEMEDLRPLLNDTFSSLWELMATYNLYKSLKENDWYDEMTLQKHYKLRIEILQPIVENYLATLNDHVPTLEIQKNDSITKFKGILA